MPRELGVRFGGGAASGAGAFALDRGLPALVVEPSGRSDRLAPRHVPRCDIDATGDITAIHTVHTELASRKRTAVTVLAPWAYSRAPAG